MKKILLLLLLVNISITAQYNTERSAEASFEHSDLYFKSHFLNTFGMKNFSQVSVGLIDNPFLNSYLNPAIMPDFKGKGVLVYLDFRGDRTEEQYISSYVPYDYAVMDRFAPYPTGRWISVIRTEPEPVFSAGFIFNPVKHLTDNFYLGVTYQFISRQENFYNNPYSIYYASPYYDSFGSRSMNAQNIPIKDRYTGKDEMVTEGHLFSVFAGLGLTDNLSIGISLNGITHSREGGYLNQNSSQYGVTDYSIWDNKNGQDKSQNYHHVDLSVGVMYKVSDKFSAGIKAGILNGTAEQKYASISRNIYNYDKRPVEDNWNSNYYLNESAQSWKHTGSNKYISFNFINNISDKYTLTGYYSYTNGSQDLTNYSAINDTSNYKYHYVYVSNNIQNSSAYNGQYSTHDNRTGTGNRTENNHQAQLVFKAALNEFTTVSAGLYVGKRIFSINSSEPVTASRLSVYHSVTRGQYQYDYNYYNSLQELKTLEWKYNADYLSVQIPILINFSAGENFAAGIGLNRVFSRWNISEQTTAYFDYRKQNENGVLKQENNFGERYTKPDEKISENDTYLIGTLNVKLTQDFKINLMFEPKLTKLLVIPQWWISFEAAL